MKYLAALVIAFFLAVAAVYAQQSPDDQYVIIYVLIQQGDASLNAGQPKQALGDYVEADHELRQFQQVYSDWNPMIVNYRLSYLAEKITALTPKVSTNAPPPKAVAPPTPADWQAQLASLNGQIQQLQGANETLQAKLKEALSVQPEGASAAAYAQLQEQVRQLSKENDLLKSTAAQMTNAAAAPHAVVAAPQNDPKLQQELAAETTRAGQLAQDNDALEAKILALTTDADAAEALRRENAVLKKELANVHLSAPTTTPAAATDTSGDLASARAQIAKLQADATENWLEKTALEKRIQQLQESSLENAVQDASQPDLQTQIHELKLERDTLLAQLGQANRKLKSRKNESPSAQLEGLAQQIETLRDRVEVDEGETVPYTPQELALFTPEPLTADPKGEKKSYHKLSATAAVLVAEAQSYFTNREYDKAAADYEEVLNQHENSPLALANLASAELEQNKITDADTHIQAALALDPNDPFSLTVLGRVRFSEGNLDGALDALGRAVKLDSQNPQIENFLGVALAQKGLRVQAETAFRKAVSLAPDYGDAHKNLAIMYLSTVPPMTEMARWHYEKALVAGVAPNPEIEKMLNTTADKNE